MFKSRLQSHNIRFPLKVSTRTTGAGVKEIVVTSSLAPKKEWVGDDEAKAIRRANDGLKVMQDTGELSDEKPAWMSSGEWTAAVR